MCCELKIQDLGKIAYEDAFEAQLSLQKHVSDSRGDSQDPFHLLLLEHDPPVVTISKRPSAKKHLLATPQQLADAGVVVCETNRGGDITYHGPGQLVGYPMLDLNELSLRIHSYMRFLETIIIDVLGEFGIEAHCDDCATGVWVGDAKICAMGVRVSKWVSMHGFALNVDPAMDHFNLIVPCGLAGRQVTSMRALLGESCPSMQSVKEIVSNVFAEAVNRQAQVQQELRP
ncbi:MAG: lipoyl(octanoyl) transferase [Phycisphaerae bacterium]|nr:lipoyl(octanoyl) transferase [Phycisphaerae bacterium]|tara:strand:+ start:3052 stop:3741 length:690 start_codon:yes stop_codon:yes gene_type:complete